MSITDKILSSELFTHNPPVLLDIGASGAIHPKWKPIAKYAVCIAFDADDREIGYTVNETGDYRKLYVFNKLVVDNLNPEAEFFLTKSPYCSSLLYPDHKNISNWNFGDLFDVEKTVRMKTAHLPAVLTEIGISKIDWFKSDSQGTDLRLFKSLGENNIDNVLVAEFEPGIIDGYIGEDKLWHIMSFMEKHPFWMSDIKICGTQRISKRTVLAKFDAFGGKIPPEMLFKVSPGWGEVTFINSFDSSNVALNLRDHLLGWIFAVIEEQFGFALDIAMSGYEKFGLAVFKELGDCAFDIISRKYTLQTALDRNISLDGIDELFSVRDLYEKALSRLTKNENELAFSLLIAAKRLKQPIQGIDYLRAVYFTRINQIDAAIQALHEELRYFPRNAEAHTLLLELKEQNPFTATTQHQDQEFQYVFAIIRPYSMLGEERLYSLFTLAKHVCEQDIPGNFVECGVAAGGSSALLAYVIKKYSKQPRFLYAFDSFEGMPTPTDKDVLNGIEADATGWGAGTCAAPEASVRNVSMELGVFHLVKTVKGYYERTLPPLSDFVAPIAFMHMDADWYESMRTILNCFYEKLSTGAFVQVDDFNYWEGVTKAFEEFETANNLSLQKNDIDGYAIWFRKINPGEK